MFTIYDVTRYYTLYNVLIIFATKFLYNFF